MNTKVVICVFLSCLIANASACTVQATSYTTEDTLVIANQIGFVTEFKLKCKSEINSIPLFAEVNGQIFPVFRVKEDYQFSWTEEKSTAGSREIKIYDEEQYQTVKKAQRAGETSSVKPLATINVRYSGSYGSGLLFFSSEFIVFAASLAAAYLGIMEKKSL